MKAHKGFLILSILLFSLISMGVIQSVQAQSAEDSRSGSLTTDKGTSIALNYTLNHDGTEGDTPLLYTNKEYLLSITVKINEFGNDVEDLHDLEFIVEISASTIVGSLVGSSTPVFSSYYFDKETSMTEANETITYDFPILITGEIEETTNLEVIFKAREAVDNRPDPSLEYSGIGYEIDIANNPENISFTYDGNETKELNQVLYTDESSNVRIDTTVSHAGEIEGKPSIYSGEQYLVTVNFTVIELGADVEDFHDLEVTLLLEDSSMGDYLPGNDPVNYFSAYAGNTSALYVGDSRTFEFVMQPNTNINDTEVDLKFTFKFRERIDGFSLDPENEFNLNVETKLNHGLSNSGEILDEANAPLDMTWGLLLVFIGIPVLRRSKRE